MADNNEELNIGIGADASKVGTETKKAADAVKGVTASARELDAAFRRLKSSIDPAFVAQEKHNQALKEADLLLKAGRISQQEYAAAATAAKAALDAQMDAIYRNSAAGRAAAEAAAQAKAAEVAAEIAANKKALEEARLAAKEKRDAEIRALQEATAADRAAKAAARAEIKAAVEASKEAARAKKKAEIDASREAAAAEKAAKAEARKASRDAAAAAREAASEKAALDRAAKASTHAAAEAAKLQAKAEREVANAVRELRGSVDPAYAAQERYNETMRRATSLLMQNKLQQNEWTIIQRQAKAQMDINTRSMGRMNSVYVQLGYQAQDVTASLASGINPLVILAQQGGQTAAALSMMGGTTGKIASFFAGPWGAAIIGATLLLGLFTQKNKEAKEATIDATNAEDLRKAKLEEFIKTLKDYNKEQASANRNASETRFLSLRGSILQIITAEERSKELEKKLKEAKEALDLLMTGPASDNSGLAILRQISRVKQLTNELQKAREAKGIADNSQTQNLQTEIRTRVAATLDERRAIEQQYQDAETAANRLHQTETENAKAIEDAKKRQLALDAANLKYAIAIRTAMVQQKNAEEALNASPRGSAGVEQQARYLLPVTGRVSSGFGARAAPTPGASTNHAGMDIAAATGTPVKAPQVGVVESVGYSPTLGKYIVLNHGAGVTTRMGHLDTTTVEKGQRVEQGQRIGSVGSTGNSTGPHLHYEVRVNGKAVDPAKGIYGIDTLEAEQKGLEDLNEAAKAAYEDKVAQLTFEQSLAGENLQVSLDLQDRKIAAAREFYGTDSKEAISASRDRVMIERRLQAQLLAEQKAGIDAREAQAEAAASTAHEVGQIKAGQGSDTTSFKENLGLITGRQALEEHAKILEEQYQQEVAFENKVYELKAQAMRDQLALANLPLKDKIEINGRLAELEAAHNQRMTVMSAQHARDVNRVNLDSLNITMLKWKGFANTISQSLKSSFQGMWTNTMTWQQAMYNLADQLVYKFVDAGAQILEDWLVKQAMKALGLEASEATQTAVVAGSQVAQTTAVATGVAARTGLVAAGAATEEGITIGSALLSIGASAAKAAAGAYAALAGIPIVGPFIAPAAAAAALIGVMGFGAKIMSASGGWGEVDKDQMAMVHKKEMILPAHIATPLRKSLSVRGAGGVLGPASSAGFSLRTEASEARGGSNHFTISAVDAGSFLKLLNDNPRVLQKAMDRQLRNALRA